jgi:hypothetical protein
MESMAMRDSNDLKGIHNAKTMGSAKMRSMPKVQGNSNYLDLYLLEKEKERLLKELKRIEIRREQINYRLDEIDKGLAVGHKKETEPKKKTNPVKTVNTEDKGQKKEWKTMNLSY